MIACWSFSLLIISSFITTTNRPSPIWGLSHVHLDYYLLHAVIQPPGWFFSKFSHWIVKCKIIHKHLALFKGKSICFSPLTPTYGFWWDFSACILADLKAWSSSVFTPWGLFQILNLPSLADLFPHGSSCLAWYILKRWTFASSPFSKLASWHNLFSLAWKKFPMLVLAKSLTFAKPVFDPTGEVFAFSLL